MSWHVTAIGRGEPLRNNLNEQISRITCIEPEHAIKGDVATLIARALSCYPANMVVKVTASGSQTNHQMSDGEFVNSLSVQIEPQWGFVE